jgi:cell division protein FtsN
MKRRVGLNICLVALILALSSCKSSESAYKKAYETAQKQEVTNNKEKTSANVITITETTSKEKHSANRIPIAETANKEKPNANGIPIAETANKEKTSANGIPIAETAPPIFVPNETNIRQEKVTIVSGNSALKTYGIVCGSFSLKANADALKDYLQSEGYSKAIVVFSTEIVMYRVIADSYSDKESAVDARNTFKVKYPDRNDFQDAWILEKL